MAKQLRDKSSNVPDAVIQKHIRAVSGLKTNLETAQGEYRAGLKAAKTAGINTGQLIAAMAAKKRELEDVQGDFRAYVRYLHLLEVRVQADMFEDVATVDEEPEEEAEAPDADAESEEQAVWQAQEAGLAAGKAGALKETNPYTRGTTQHQVWITHWTKGQETLIEKDGVKAASPRRNRNQSARLN